MKAKKNALEWTVFGVSLLIIAATIALLARGAMRAEGPHADLHVATGTAVRAPNGYVVPVVVSNRGDLTAEQARIQIALVSGGRDVERAELTIAFVPRQSRREGAVVFHRDPRCCVIAARAVAYENP